jgi:uncharacterized protein (UPF0276 family)
MMNVPKLGIGLNYQPQLRSFIEEHAGEAFDFLEAVPDIFWIDHGRGSMPRYVDHAEAWRFLDGVAARVPVIPHSIGLSIGSAHRFNHDHLGQMRACYDRLRFPWHSDHLAFHLTGHEDPASVADDNVGVTMPLPRTRATLDMLRSRIDEVRAAVPTPFLLENNVAFVDMPGAEFTEPEFLNQLCRTSGCGLVLDLHNVYTNARNLGFDAFDFVSQLDLTPVVEIHIAGGFELGGFYYDSHSGATPEPVWELLEWVAPRAPNLSGIVFEIFGTWYGDMGADRMRDELARMRAVWHGCHRRPEGAAA